MSELNEQTGAVPEPTWVEMLRFSGVSPDVWNAMTDARRAEWRRAYDLCHPRGSGAEQGVDAHVA